MVNSKEPFEIRMEKEQDLPEIELNTTSNTTISGNGPMGVDGDIYRSDGVTTYITSTESLPLSSLPPPLPYRRRNNHYSTAMNNLRKHSGASMAAYNELLKTEHYSISEDPIAPIEDKENIDFEKGDSFTAARFKEEYEQYILDYFNGDDLAKDVFLSKYKAYDGETPRLMHKRIASELARIEANYPNPLKEEEIFDLLDNFKYLLPGGSVLYGAGTDNLTSLSNCFVVGNEDDSYGGILRAEQEMIHLMKRRGGVGLDLSHIRPKSSPINNAAKTSTGIVPFMERYSNSTREVAQDGRRGALMLSLDVEHNDAKDFLTAKTDLTKITGANISLRVSNSFMRGYSGALTPYDIAKVAHKTAEPGILFWDKIISESPADCYKDKGFRTISTNPCGEIPLSPYDSCRLLAINLFAYIENPFTKEANFLYEKFSKHVQIAQRLLDDIIDLEIEKVDNILAKIDADTESAESKEIESNLWHKVRKAATDGRRTGLGITGFADMFASLGIKYGDDQSLLLIKDLFEEFSAASYAASITLAKERGAFPVFNKIKEMNNPFISRVIQSIKKSAIINSDSIIKDYNDYGRRNIANLTIAPTGSISILAQVSSGVENVFQLNYTRRRKVEADYEGKYPVTIDDNGDSWIKYNVLHHNFKLWMDVNGIESNNLSEEIIHKYYIQSPYYGTIVKDIDPIKKVQMQGLIQKYIDHSISNTCNLPEKASIEDVEKVIFTAWESGCKGITVYRENSRDGIMVANKDTEAKGRRPESLDAFIELTTINGRESYVLIGMLNGNPYEVFILDKALLAGKIPPEILLELDNGQFNDYVISKYRDNEGGQSFYSLESHTFGIPALHNIVKYTIKEDGKFSTRLISLMMRKGISPEDIIGQIDKSDENITHLYKVLARVLSKKYNLEGNMKCPECNNIITVSGGCATCYSCGYSKCS